MTTIEAAISAADYVLVPCKPSPVDIAATGDTLSMIEDQGKAFAFVMNRVIPRTRIGEQAILLLVNPGKVAGKPIAHRTPFATAMTDGRSAPEVGAGKQAEEEIGALWTFVPSNRKK